MAELRLNSEMNLLSTRYRVRSDCACRFKRQIWMVEVLRETSSDIGRTGLTGHEGELLDPVFPPDRQALEAVNALVHQQPVPLSDGALAVPVPLHDLPLPAQQRAAQRQSRRQALHTQVWTLHRQGWTAPAIAQQVGLSLRTVQRD